MEPWTYLPNPWRDGIASLPQDKLGTLEEVRFRLDRPAYCYGAAWGMPLRMDNQTLTISQQDLDRIVGIIAEHSLYARMEELRQGYLTLPGGHRVGVAGKAIWKDGTIITMTEITGLNFRRARYVQDAAKKMLEIFNRNRLDIESLLVAGPPPGVARRLSCAI